MTHSTGPTRSAISTPSAKRIGLTMRVDPAAGYAERRDGLAQDWAVFLADALPEVLWVPIPNLGPAAGDYAEALGLTGLILTGGNDVGSCPARDDTEAALIAHFLRRDLPIFGVCRGLQMLQTYCGGGLQPCDRAGHVAATHEIRTGDPGTNTEQWTVTRTVNSFHAQAVSGADLAAPLHPFAVTADGLVEGFRHREAAVTAVQWHPERCRPVDPADRALLRQALKMEEQ